MTACSIGDNFSRSSGDGLDKQNYLFKCQNEMVVRIELYKKSNTFNFVKTSTASFAAGDVVLERYSGKAEGSGRNRWNLVVANEPKRIMTLMLNVDGAYVLNNYDISNPKNICEGALFESIY
jgi:hypothetical protein